MTIALTAPPGASTPHAAAAADVRRRGGEGERAAAATGASSRRGSWRTERRRAYLAGLLPALVVLGLITLLPAIALLVASLTPFSLTDPVATFRFDAPLANYRHLLDDTRFLGSVATQLKLSASSVLLQLGVGLGLALLLNGPSRLLGWVRTAFLIPMVLPPIVVALIWKILYTPDVSPLHRALEAVGLPLSSLIANPATALWAISLADTWQWFPFTMLMVLAALQMIPDEPLEAARLDGADCWQLFRYIVLPYLRPVLLVCGLFRLIDSFKAFPLIYVLTDGGPGSVTEVTNYYAFIEGFNFSYWGYASAIATLLLAGVLGLSWLISRLGRPARGMTMGAEAAVAPTVTGAVGGEAARVPAVRRRRPGTGPAAAARPLAAVVLLLVVMFPFLWLVHLAFKPAAQFFDDALLFTPTLDAFRVLLTQGNFSASFWNSLVVSSASTVLSLVIGVPASYALTRWRFKGRERVALWILVTRMAPPIAFTIPFFLAFRWLGLQDTRTGLVIVYLTFNLAIVIWLMQTFFEAVPTSLEEAAWIDGCTIWQAFWRVTLPLAAPGLAATAVLCFIFSWNDFFYALILTRTQAVTAPVAIVNFLQYEGWEWSKIAAAGTLVMLPVVLFTVLVRRYLVHGLTAGGVKD